MVDIKLETKQKENNDNPNNGNKYAFAIGLALIISATILNIYGVYGGGWMLFFLFIFIAFH